MDGLCAASRCRRANRGLPEEEPKSELAALCDELERKAYAVHMYLEEVGVSQSDLVKLLAAARRAEEAERERARLQKLFDDAGEGAYNVLALIDHYQDEAIENARAAAFLRTHGETLREGLRAAISEAVNDEWIAKAEAADQALAEVMKNG